MIALKALAIIIGAGAFITALFVLIIWIGTRDLVRPDDEPNINDEFKDYEF